MADTAMTFDEIMDWYICCDGSIFTQFILSTQQLIEPPLPIRLWLR